MYSHVESPHRGDSNEYTQYLYTLFNILKKITLNYPKSGKIMVFYPGLMNEFETAVVNEPSVFKPLSSAVFYRQSDYDSWGEETDSEDEEDQGQYMPQPYPMQPYPGPPQVVFGAPFPMFYPPPPPQRRKLRDKGRGEPERIKQYKIPNRDRDRFEDVERSVPSKSKKKNRVQFNSVPTSFYPFPTYPYPYPAFYEDQQPRKKKESKYKVPVLL